MLIDYIGLRTGERLHETLFHVDERYCSTLHPSILQAMPRAVIAEQVEASVESLRAFVDAYDLEGLGVALREAVPEFAPTEERARPAAVVMFPGRRARS